MSSADLADPDAVVRLREVEVREGARIGVAMLNAEKTLNSLSLAMIELLGPTLERWRSDPKIVAVILHGAGDRAFCAGGDIQALYHSMARNHAAGERIDDYAESFFAAEYRLDYALHTFPKPVITFGHGIVMGGGLGLFSASGYRLVTAKSRIALPEVTIGLFPDAGATWTLKALRPHHALFIGATGCSLNGADALYLGIATHAVDADWSKLFDSLSTIDWHGDASDRVRIDAMLVRSEVELSEGPLRGHDDAIATALPRLPDSAAALGAALTKLSGTDEWLDRAIATMKRGCATSVGIVLEQVRRASALTMADSFRLEMTIATHCARNPDFAEGVRALLIEKDNAPRWRYPDLDALPPAYVESHFVEPWPVNPLSNLETSRL